MNLLAYGHSDCDLATADLATEEPLSGGRLTAGVVRVGDTVRRPSKCSSRFTEELLGRLAATGFQGAPRYLGKDAQSRDMLSFIEGWVPAKFQHFSNAQIYDGGVLLRAYHDSTRGSALAGDSPVVCHNDPGPNNVVFRNGMPAAFIDFDLAAPGDPLEDLGYAVWTWCVSSKPERGPVQDQAFQARLFADAYGLCAADRSLVVDAMLERQRRNIHFWQLHLSSGDPALPATGQQIHDRINWSCREMEFTRRNAGAFAAELTR